MDLVLNFLQNIRNWKYVAVHLASGLVGLTVGLRGVLRLRDGPDVTLAPGFEYWVVVVSFVAGILVFRFDMHRIGNPGWKGFFGSYCGALRMLVFGALLGGTIMLPLHGTIYAPIVVMCVVLSSPLELLLWACQIALCHKLMHDWRRERQLARIEAKAREKLPDALVTSTV